jgi:hypothetical protein
MIKLSSTPPLHYLYPIGSVVIENILAIPDRVY